MPNELWEPIWAAMGRVDLYFLLIGILSSGQGAPYLMEGNRHPWLFKVCREIEANPNGFLDVYAREHYKTTIITFGKTIQDLVNNPELSFGIFAFKNPIAESFVRQIKVEFESNELLKRLYPEALYENPSKESDLWSVQSGFTIKRKGNPREPTLEASGLADGQPVSRHYDYRIYDDCVTEASVTTEEQQEKVLRAWENSTNLGKEGGGERHLGTRYHRYDLYQTIIDRKAAIPRIRPCYEVLGTGEDGTTKYGKPVLYTQEYLDKKRVAQGRYTFACQMLCDPVSSENQGLNPTWLKYYTRHPADESRGKNLYLICDPAHSKKKDSDYTVMLVIGLGADKNIYVIDGIRKRMDLQERGNEYIRLQKRWGTVPFGNGYERYGAQADVQFIEFLMDQHYGYRFPIEELGGQMAKEDRILRLAGPMENGRIYFPRFLPGEDGETGRQINLIEEIVRHEITPFPFSKHDDFIDCLSRIFDMTMVYPDPLQTFESPYDDFSEVVSTAGSWLSE